MHPALGDVVHPVLHRGLDLKQRLEHGQQLELDIEQAVLKDLLLAESETDRVPEYGPDRARLRGNLCRSPVQRSESTQSDFLGVRYALACWLDELFTLDDSDWSTQWNEQKLEVELYGSNDRSWRFWQQAQLAQSRTSDDALEAFYLIVMLGFRGDLRNRDQQLRGWAATARRRLGQIHEVQWPYASQLNMPLPARPLHGRRRLRTMVMVATLALMSLIPGMTFLLIWRLGS